MLRTTNPQHSLWEAILPEACLGLPAELAQVDRLLDDPAFLLPLRPYFDPRIGRPSVPLDTYLRLMFLKFRYQLGYELLCREVADSISWQRFCRIPLGGQVPHPTTLVKLTRRLGEQTVTALNEALLATAAEHKVLRTHRVRADTTVVAANVCYPTDARLLARAIGKLQTTIGRIRAAGAATRTTTRDRRRAAHRRAHQVAKTLRARSEQAKQAVLRTTGELADLASQTVGDAVRVVRNARRHLARVSGSGRLAGLLDELETTIARTAKVISQTRTRLVGQTPDGASRLVSLHDPDARPIVKGRLGKPVEFGYKAQVADNPDGIVLDYQVQVGNPLTRRCWLRPSRGSRPAPAASQQRSPPTAAMARPPSTSSWPPWAWSGWRSRARASPAVPAKPLSTLAGSAGWSNGAPAPRDASATSSIGSAGTAPAWTASTAPGSGAAMECSPTTWSRSAG
jgi:transposase, IS5 family